MNGPESLQGSRFSGFSGSAEGFSSGALSSEATGSVRGAQTKPRGQVSNQSRYENGCTPRTITIKKADISATVFLAGTAPC